MIVAKVLLTAWLVSGIVLYAIKNGRPKEGTYKLSDAVVCGVVAMLILTVLVMEHE